jgi:hypothetical protein
MLMAMSFLINTPVNARLVNWLPWSVLKIFGLPYLARCGYSKLRNVQNSWRFPRTRHTIVGMITYLSALASLLSFRFRSRASLELELLALRHQVTVLRRRRPREAVLRGSAPLGVAVSDLAAGLERHGAGQAGNRYSMASQRLPALLAVAIRITPLGSAQDKPADP